MNYFAGVVYISKASSIPFVTFHLHPSFNGGLEKGTTAPTRDADTMQDRILEELARDGILAGTLDALASRFDISSDDLRVYLRELVHAGKIAVQTQPGEYLTVRLERRSNKSLRAGRDRRRVRFDSWRL